MIATHNSELIFSCDFVIISHNVTLILNVVIYINLYTYYYFFFFYSEVETGFHKKKTGQLRFPEGIAEFCSGSFTYGMFVSGSQRLRFGLLTVDL